MGNGFVQVDSGNGKKEKYSADHIILATGARSKELPNLKLDGKKIIGYREALALPKLPESMVVVGSGAIGSEFAYFYQTLGCQVTLVEFLPNVVPLEDPEVSKQLERSFKKIGMKYVRNNLGFIMRVERSNMVATLSLSKRKIQACMKKRRRRNE